MGGFAAGYAWERQRPMQSLESYKNEIISLVRNIMARGGLRGGRQYRKVGTKPARKSGTVSGNLRGSTMGAKRPARRNLRGFRPKPLPRSRPGVAPVSKIHCLNGNVTNSVFRLSSRPSKQVSSIEKIGAPNVMTNQLSFINLNGSGFQGLNSCRWLDNASLLQMTNILQTPGAGAGVVPYRYVLESVIGNLTMTNTGTGPVEIELYDLVLKRDLPASIFEFASGSPGAVAYTASPPTPNEVWTQMIYMNNASVTTSPPSPATFIGASPFDCTVWKNYFKVKKRTQVLLTQGGTHRHGVLLKPNRLIDSTLIQQSNSPNGVTIPNSLFGVRGLCTFTMIVQKGLPITNAEAVTDVSTSAGQVACVQDYRYKYTYVQDNTYYVRNLDNLTTPAVQQIVNIGSGAVENIAFTV